MTDQKAQEENFDEKIEEVKTVKSLTAKQIKALAKPEFSKNPSYFYPTTVFEKYGFSRTQCPVCSAFYWRHSETQNVCGDSQCVGKYTFIGKGAGIGRSGKKINYTEAYESFKRTLTSGNYPCTTVDRYPVVARWRNDVDFVAAGIFCYQPFCVTGELEPPANPLIQPQFCLRFNDLDNIGLTGRHYSGFVMLGIQAFNYPGKEIFWKDQCVEQNIRWLLEELQIDPNEITFIEDVWAGGGNMGPSVEYFVGGLEVGNMVFMQYKYFPDGSREELAIKVIDVGIGLERIPWLINGDATSYTITFKEAYEYIQSVLKVEHNNEIWEKLGPYSCLLNIDEVDNIDSTWQQISETIQEDVQIVKKAISDIRDLFIILDHTRSVLMTITDGSLPSNVGGGGNVRNILRRCFALLKKHNWWDKLKMEGFLEIFEAHKRDLTRLYGPFREYKSFASIISIEYERWIQTDVTQKQKLDKAIKSSKGKQFTIDDWIVAITSWGIPADIVSQVTGQPVPGNLYYEIANRQEQVAKVQMTELYDTTKYEETSNLYYNSHELAFEAIILGVMENQKDKKKRNIVVLDKSAFYPTSGGQQHDTGTLVIKGESYSVVNCERVGKCVLHILDRELLLDDSQYLGENVQCLVEGDRRNTLKNHHSATHIMFASARNILGPHVWQAGAKKTLEQAHIDITHFQGLSKQEEISIENFANSLILKNYPIKKYILGKAEAEKEFGFHLYQGGIIPGNTLRIVHIEETDVEACCGTHCDRTSEVGWIRLLKSARISDGIVRLYFVAGTKTMDKLNFETGILNELCNLWSINKNQLVETGERFFREYKRLTGELSDKTYMVLNLQLRYVLDGNNSLVFMKSSEQNATLYFSHLSAYAQDLQTKQKGIIFLGEKFIFGLLAKPDFIDQKQFAEILKNGNPEAKVTIKTMNSVTYVNPNNKKKVQTDGILQFSFIGAYNNQAIEEFLSNSNYTNVEF